MPTYSYSHTLDSERTSKACLDFDTFQSIKDDPLKECPTCKEPVKRVITSPVGFTMPGGTPKFHG